MPRYPARPEYQTLPWRQIREQYETTDVSLRMLAMQWRLASKTTLARKISNEGWTRRIATIATHLSLLEVAGASEPPPPPPDGEAEKIDGDTLHREADPSIPLTARKLAAMQSQRVLRQLEFAEQVQEAGRAILRHLLGVLTGEEDKVGGHIKRLISIGPDGEKLATLMKAAAEAIDRGVIIERRALGMDMIKGQVPNPAGGSLDRDTKNAVRTVRKLDVGLGLKLRNSWPPCRRKSARHGRATNERPGRRHMKLSIRDLRRCRRIPVVPGTLRQPVHITTDQNTKVRFNNDKSRCRLTTSVEAADRRERRFHCGNSFNDFPGGPC